MSVGTALVRIALACLLAVAPVLATATELEDLFRKGKDLFRRGDYRASLETFEALFRMSQEPRFAQERPQVEPAVRFYRGANLAQLGETARAEEEFAAFLAVDSEARLDPAIYPKRVLDTFRKVQKEIREGRHAPAPSGGDTALASEYARFQAPADATLPADERWAAGAVLHLMTEAERREWDSLRDGVERARFVSEFWARRDPDSFAPGNPVREELERRLLFADSRFATEEKRGRETDYGIVFVLLGPPSHTRSGLLRRQGDYSAESRKPATRESVFREGTASADGKLRPLVPPSVDGTKDVWHYRRDRLPKDVAFAEVSFEFVTQKGAGSGVLQRDASMVLTTLDAAARSFRPAAE